MLLEIGLRKNMPDPFWKFTLCDSYYDKFVCLQYIFISKDKLRKKWVSYFEYILNHTLFACSINVSVS